MQMKREQFNQLAKATFGDKVIIRGIDITDEALAELNAKMKSAYEAAMLKDPGPFPPFVPYKREDLDSYPEYPWVVGDNCPVCNTPLDGLFGSFAWGMIHGEGYCTECRHHKQGTYFRLYHYVTERARPLVGYALVGFPDLDAPEPEEDRGTDVS